MEVIKDRDSGRSKGFAFVEMSTQAEVESAIKAFNGYSLDSRQLKVSIARPCEERPQGGGGWYSDFPPKKQLQLTSRERKPPGVRINLYH